MTSFCLLLGFFGVLFSGDVSSASEGGSQAHRVMIRTKSWCAAAVELGKQAFSTRRLFLVFIYFYIHLFIFEEPCDLDRHIPVVSCLSQDQHFPLVELNSSFSQDKHSLYYCMKPLPSVWGTVKLFFFLFELEIEPRAMYMVGQLSITELRPQPFYKCFYQQFL